jgi:hypothetical protein
MNQLIILLIFLLSYIHISYSTWLPKEVAQNIVDEWDKEEELRSNIGFRGTDRRSSSPFITGIYQSINLYIYLSNSISLSIYLFIGDSFRYRMEHICEDSNRCRMTPENVKSGQCVFVKTDQFNYFVTDVSKRITNPYIIISHNGDLSSPDGQDDAARIGLPRYITSDILDREYKAGRLISHHGQNLWWKNKTIGEPRPSFSHCLPIGFENRQYPVGKAVGTIYINALKKYIINRPTMTLAERNNRPLLLVAFYPKSRVPDRHGVLVTLGAIPPRGQAKPTNTWYNETDLSHAEWLDGIVSHKFVLAPFGHGLDTHRISEILGILFSLSYNSLFFLFLIIYLFIYLSNNSNGWYTCYEKVNY